MGLMKEKVYVEQTDNVEKKNRVLSLFVSSSPGKIRQSGQILFLLSVIFCCFL